MLLNILTDFIYKACCWYSVKLSVRDQSMYTVKNM